MVKLCEKIVKKVATYATAPATFWCDADSSSVLKLVPCGLACAADADGRAVDLGISQNLRLNLRF